MNAATPIRNKEELERFKEYYRNEEYNMRNLTLITIGLNTALRVSDILNLKWDDVYDFEKNEFKKHITINEKKTGKRTQIFINRTLLKVLNEYKDYVFNKNTELKPDMYLIKGRGENHLSRVQAYRVVKKNGDACGIQGITSPHSLRKTFGYFAYRAKIAPVMLMCIFNHSSFNVTKRYLGIEQEDRDEVFNTIQI